MKLSRTLLTVILSIVGFTSSHLFSDTFASKNVEHGTLGQYMDPTHPGKDLTETQILNLEALKAIGQEDWKTASKKLKAAFSKDAKNPETFHGFAKFHYARKEYASCENAIVKGLEQDPEHGGLLYEQSRISTLKDDLSSAIDQAKRSTESNDSKWRYHYWYSHLLTVDGQAKAAKSALSSAVELIGKEIKELDKTINKYELQERVLSSYTATEEVPVGTVGGGYKQIEVVKYNTERMVAPDAWKNQLAALKAKKIELTKKLKSL